MSEVAEQNANNLQSEIIVFYLYRLLSTCIDEKRWI